MTTPPVLFAALAAVPPLSYLATTEMPPSFLAVVRELGSFGVLLMAAIWLARRGARLLEGVAESQHTMAEAMKQAGAAQAKAFEDMVEGQKEAARETAEQHRAILAASERIRAYCERMACELGPPTRPIPEG